MPFIKSYFFMGVDSVSVKLMAEALFTQMSMPPKVSAVFFTASCTCSSKRMSQWSGRALPLVCDIRYEEQVVAAVEKTVATFGGIDICVNNASAIQLTGTLQTDMKRYDLMNGINARGTYLTGRTCIPHLKKAANPHILTLSPPLDIRTRWFAPHVAYSTAKYGMSLCTLGWSEEFKADGIAANSLWPRTTIATAAVRMLGGDPFLKKSRTPEIMADAAYVILNKKSREYTGKFCIDDVVLWNEGVKDFAKYAAVPGTPDKDLLPDFFLPDDTPKVG